MYEYVTPVVLGRSTSSQWYPATVYDDGFDDPLLRLYESEVHPSLKLTVVSNGITLTLSAIERKFSVISLIFT
jgi:hypothetical protein